MLIKVTSKSQYSERRIFLDGNENFVAKTMSLLSADDLKISNLETGYTIATISKEILFLKDQFNIRLLNEHNVALKFKKTGIATQNYNGFYLERLYEIRHGGNFLYTIFRNNVEIGFWRNANSLGEVDDFEILSIENDLDLIICLCVVIHTKQCERRNPD